MPPRSHQPQGGAGAAWAHAPGDIAQSQAWAKAVSLTGGRGCAAQHDGAHTLALAFSPTGALAGIGHALVLRGPALSQQQAPQ
jgi:hypothetical protein